MKQEYLRMNQRFLFSEWISWISSLFCGTEQVRACGHLRRSAGRWVAHRHGIPKCACGGPNAWRSRCIPSRARSERARTNASRILVAKIKSSCGRYVVEASNHRYSFNVSIISWHWYANCHCHHYALFFRILNLGQTQQSCLFGHSSNPQKAPHFTLFRGIMALT